jgi:hypothetical protein
MINAIALPLAGVYGQEERCVRMGYDSPPGERSDARTPGEAMQQYTCSEYRREMILMGLKRQAADPGIDELEREKLEAQIRQLERELDME